MRWSRSREHRLVGRRMSRMSRMSWWVLVWPWAGEFTISLSTSAIRASVRGINRESVRVAAAYISTARHLIVSKIQVSAYPRGQVFTFTLHSQTLWRFGMSCSIADSCTAGQWRPTRQSTAPFLINSPRSQNRSLLFIYLQTVPSSTTSTSNNQSSKNGESSATRNQ
jgi:hypothetical protein